MGNGRVNGISNYAKKGCFVISKVTIWGYLMRKCKKSIKSYALARNKRTKTCAFRIIVVSLHQKKKQIKPQDPEGQRDYEAFKHYLQQRVHNRAQQPSTQPYVGTYGTLRV
jgi:hypothetical protein